MLQKKKVSLMNGREIDRIDVKGKWPKQTWLQKRIAMVKLVEAKQALALAVDGKLSQVVDENG